jgi:Tol biopolymer transport system component
LFSCRTKFTIIALGLARWGETKLDQHEGVAVKSFNRVPRILVPLVVVAAMTLALPTAAHGVVPGKNGRIAFGRDGFILTMAADGSDEQQLTSPTGTIGYSPTFSPDGTKIAFQANDTDGDIYVINANGTGAAVELTNTDLGIWEGHATWSPDGTQIAYSRGTGLDTADTDIWLMDADGDNPINLTNSTGRDSNPAFSSTGKIAFESMRDGNDLEIYSMDPISTSTPVPITANDNIDLEASWSPDATKIAFASFRSGAGDIYVTQGDGSTPTTATRLTNNTTEADFEPAWSPDGTKIAFRSSRRSGNNDVWVMDSVDADTNGNGDNVVGFTDNAGSEGAPDWQTIPPPANDDFADAQLIPGTDASVNGTTLAATIEAGEPDHYVITDEPEEQEDNDWNSTHSVWYKWRALGSGPTTIDTCVAAIDSLLAVYRGSVLTSLTQLADNNNNFCGGGFGSFVSFNARAGRTYRIAVDDAGGAREAGFTLDVDGQPNDPPVVKRLRPRPDSSTTDRTPQISARVRDSVTELVKNDIDFFLDGNPKPGFTYDQAIDRLSFTPGRLSLGRHRAKVVASDDNGGTTTRKWSFRITR